MKNNSKSGLKINHIISSVLILIVLSSNIPLFIPTKEVAKNNKQEELAENNKQEELTENNIQEEVTIADYYEREINTTSRSAGERTQTSEQELETNLDSKLEQVEEVAIYKSIDEIRISKNMDLTLRCGISKENFKKLMKGLTTDTSGFFYENSDMIYDLCEKYELNEIFFCGLIAAESGWDIAKTHRNKCNYISMMSNGKMIKFSSTKEGLEAAAKLLHGKYLTPDGEYYEGKTLKDIQKAFCPNSSTWVGLVYDCMKQIVK